MKMLRTIRLDPSDTFVFARAAEPGEWAVTGSFLFWGRDVAALAGKERAAFRSGFVGVSSLGFSTLVVAQPIRPDERAAAIDSLARHLVDRLGAPDLDTARAAAAEEIAFAASLAEHDEGTLVAMHRAFEDGEIREQHLVGDGEAATLHAPRHVMTGRDPEFGDGAGGRGHLRVAIMSIRSTRSSGASSSTTS